MINSTRRENILKAVVWEFINSGKPVSSERLYNHYNFGIKPAMIRKELLRLSKEKYLFQPHYSSGRMPTDLGYEFFVKKILEDDNFHFVPDYSLINFFKKCDWRNLAKLIAQKLKILSLIKIMPGQNIYKEGLQYLIDKLEWCSFKDIKCIIQDFEKLEEEVENFFAFFNEKNFIKFFIGRNNPFTRSAYLAAGVGDYDIDDQRVFVLILGPKRMDYKQIYFTLKGFKKYIQNNGRK